jgi:hypothetical protein
MIEDDEDEDEISNSKIHSIQNGLLLAETAHTYFDKYKIAINPDVRVFTSVYKMILILIFSRTIIKSPVSLETLLALMVGTWSSEMVPNDISLIELSSNTTFAKLYYATWRLGVLNTIGMKISRLASILSPKFRNLRKENWDSSLSWLRDSTLFLPNM